MLMWWNAVSTSASVSGQRRAWCSSLDSCRLLSVVSYPCFHYLLATRVVCFQEFIVLNWGVPVHMTSWYMVFLWTLIDPGHWSPSSPSRNIRQSYRPVANWAGQLQIAFKSPNSGSAADTLPRSGGGWRHLTTRWAFKVETQGSIRHSHLHLSLSPVRAQPKSWLSMFPQNLLDVQGRVLRSGDSSQNVRYNFKA